jgi:hypothetical protein
MLRLKTVYKNLILWFLLLQRHSVCSTIHVSLCAVQYMSVRVQYNICQSVCSTIHVSLYAVQYMSACGLHPVLILINTIPSSAGSTLIILYLYTWCCRIYCSTRDAYPCSKRTKYCSRVIGRWGCHSIFYKLWTAGKNWLVRLLL